ncbi:MAG: FtsX-like permease family protein [Bacteroidota bacterium]
MIGKIAWKNIVHKPLSSILCVSLLLFGVGIITVLLLIQKQLEDKFERDLKDIDLVIGAKGSPLQLVLSSVYHLDAPTGNIDMAEARTIMENPMVAEAIPLAYGDSYRGYRILGTTEAYLNKYDAQIRDGRIFSSPMEATLGARIAEKTGLKVGDVFLGTHGEVKDGGEVHEDSPYTVVGILENTNTVLDQLLLTRVESVWQVHDHGEHGEHKGPGGVFSEGREVYSAQHQGLPTVEHGEHGDHEGHDHGDHEGHDHGDHEGHDHDDHKGHDHDDHEGHDHDDHEGHDHDDHEGHDHDDHEGHDHGDHEGHDHDDHEGHDHSDHGEQNEEITAVLLKYKSKRSVYNMPRSINEQTNMQAVIPSIEINRLFYMLGIGATTLKLIAAGIMLMAGLSVFFVLYNRLRERRYEVALMRSVGYKPFDLFGLLILEGAILAAMGYALGWVLSRVGLYFINRQAQNDFNQQFDLGFVSGEIWLIAITILVGILAAFLPAWQAMRMEVSETLSEN